jgi:hypothetical protein
VGADGSVAKLEFAIELLPLIDSLFELAIQEMAANPVTKHYRISAYLLGNKQLK